ncbi:MAG: carboxypeptidase regulatory-like domain-containing protein [Bryobacteraceae bacterium]
MSQVRSWGIRFLTLASIMLLLSTFVVAQSDTASITGFVRDASGAVVPSANIVIRNEATGIERKTVSNPTGYFIVPNLPPALYTISVEATGFKKFESTQNKLDPNITATVDVNLQVGSATDTVTVVAEVVGIQSDSATVGRVITQKEVQDTPLNGRNPLFLALLKPGVSGGALAQFSFDLSTGGLNINGGRTQDNLITFDGAVGVRTRSNGTSIGTADVDAVQEVQVLTSNYGAEYGRSSAGQVRIVTKSGGKDFHGSAYEYFRNSAMNANEWARNRVVGQPNISSQAAPFRYNQYGWSVSGPLYIPNHFNKERNKLFFLFSQEWTKFRREELQQQVVPTDAMKRGDFSQLLGPNSFFGSPQYIRDPLAVGNCNATDRSACFSGNIIPASRLSPQGVALLNSYPSVTPGFSLGRNNYLISPLRLDNQRKDTGAVDYLPKENHYIRFRVQNFSLFHKDSNRGGTDIAPAQLDRPNQTASLNYIWTVSPTVVNEFLLSASADHVKISVIPGKYERSKYGINYPYIFQQKEIFDKVPTTEIANFATIDGGPYPSSSAGPIYDLSDNLTKVAGNHTFKFGGVWERQGQNDFDQINVNGVPGGTNNQNGRFVFNDSRPGGSNLAIANAALGLYTTYAELGTRAYTPYRGNMWELYAQDSWKVNTKLHLDYGLRYTVIQPYYSLWRNMSVFDQASYDPSKAVQLSPTTGYVIPGTGDIYNGVIIPGSGFTNEAKGRFPASTDSQYTRLFKGSKEYSKTHYDQFQPRLGLAYAVSDKMVFRSGVGRYFTRLGVSDSVFLGGNPPFQPTVSTSNGLVDNPGAAAAAGSVPFPLTLTSQDPIFKNPESYQWNATVQREVMNGTTVEVAYVGRRAIHQQRERNINQLQPGTVQANPGVNPDFLRPYKGFAVIRVTNNDANATYNGLQIAVNKRYSKGLAYGLAYTYSKSMDDGSAQRDILPNAFNAHNLWGPSDFDRRHVFVGNVMYELPFFREKNMMGTLLGGWQIGMLVQLQSGVPLTVGTGDDVAGVGPGNGSGVGTGSANGTSNNSMPPTIYNIVGDPHLSSATFSNSASDPTSYFNTAAFVKPNAGTFTTQSNRNVLYNPGFQNWTASLFKTFRIGDRQGVTFRSEFYNFPNHPNWSNVDSVNPTAASFGKVLNKNFERTLQLSLRYQF